MRMPLLIVAPVSTRGTEGEISAYTSAGDSSAKGVGVGVSAGIGVSVAVGAGVSVGTGVSVAVAVALSVGTGVSVGVSAGWAGGAVVGVGGAEGVDGSDGADWLHAVSAITANEHTTSRPKHLVELLERLLKAWSYNTTTSPLADLEGSYAKLGGQVGGGDVETRLGG